MYCGAGDEPWPCLAFALAVIFVVVAQRLPFGLCPRVDHMAVTKVMVFTFKSFELVCIK